MSYHGLGQTTAAVRVSAAPPTGPAPETMARVYVGAAGRLTPVECALVQELSAGRGFDKFAIKRPVPLNANIIVAAALRPPIAVPADPTSIARQARETPAGRDAERTGGLSFVTLGYVPDLRVVYLVYRATRQDPNPVPAQNALQNAIYTATRARVLSAAGQVPPGMLYPGAAAAIGAALEDARAVFMDMFRTSVAWDFRLELARFEGPEVKLAEGQRAVSSATGVAASAESQIPVASGSPDPAAALQALLSPVEQTLRQIDDGVAASTAGTSAALQGYQTRLPDLLKTYAERKIAKIRHDLADPRATWVSCRVWADAEAKLPELEAGLTRRAASIQAAEAWYTQNAAAINEARAALTRARDKINAALAAIGVTPGALDFLTKKLGPLPVWAWGLIGVGGLVAATVGVRVIRKRRRATAPAPTPTKNRRYRLAA